MNSEAFGQTHDIFAVTSNPLRFAGQYVDLETKLQYNYRRDYVTATGRYNQRDPSGLLDGPNTYTYAGQSPTRWIDPKGLLHLGKPKPNAAGTVYCDGTSLQWYIADKIYDRYEDCPDILFCFIKHEEQHVKDIGPTNICNGNGWFAHKWHGSLAPLYDDTDEQKRYETSAYNVEIKCLKSLLGHVCGGGCDNRIARTIFNQEKVLQEIMSYPYEKAPSNSF